MGDTDRAAAGVNNNQIDVQGGKGLTPASTKFTLNQNRTQQSS